MTGPKGSPLLFWFCIGLGGGGFVDEFKAAFAGDALRQSLGGGKIVAGVNVANRLGVVVPYVNSPDRDFFALVVLRGFGAVKENSAPRAARGGLVECGMQSAECGMIGIHITLGSEVS